jgi:hypothetical protein
MATAGLHEDLQREDKIVGPSDRKFGLTIGTILALISGWKGYQGSLWAYALAGLGGLLIVLGMARPTVLAPLNKAWLQLGLVLYRVVNPVVMAVLFFGTILPMGLLMRASGKDLLRLKKDGAAKSYWLPNTEGRPLSESMRQQF